MSLTSSQRDDYRRNAAPPRIPVRPNPLPRLSLPFQGRSTSSSDYQFHPVVADQQTVPAKELARARSVLSFGETSRQHQAITSSYRDDFRQLELARDPISAGPVAPRLNLPFTGQSTSRAEYRAYSDIPMTSVNRPRTAAAIPEPIETSTTFYGQTTNRADYDVKYLPAPSTFIHEEHPHEQSAPFDGASSYRSDFIPLPLERLEPSWAGKLMDDSRIEMPFVGITTNRTDYTVKPLPERPSFVPSEQDHELSSPFDGTTSYRADFVQFPASVARDAARIPDHATHSDRTVGVDADIGFRQKTEIGTSSYTADFPAWELPHHETEDTPDYRFYSTPFEGCSTMKSSFVPMDLPIGHHSARSIFVDTEATERQRRASTQLTGHTTNQVDYPAWPSAVETRPEEQPYRYRYTPFEGQSTMKSDFVVEKRY